MTPVRWGAIRARDCWRAACYWQATDTQLNREVALKILPDAFAADPDRLARFTREAQILASLNHPNIGTVKLTSPGHTRAG